MGYTPQFTAVTLYSTTGQVVCTGSQVKSSLFLTTLDRWTFSGDGGGTGGIKVIIARAFKKLVNNYYEISY